MSIELMLNAVNLNLMSFSNYLDSASVRGQVFAVFVISIAAAEAAVGLAIVLSIYRNRDTVEHGTVQPAEVVGKLEFC